MRFSFTSLIRLAVVLATFVNVVAIGLGQKKPASKEPTWKWSSHGHQEGVSDYLLSPSDLGSHLLDPEQGALKRIELGSEDRVDHVSISGWCDEQGERQAVGRWARRSSLGKGCTTYDEFGLLRFLYPSGQVLDRIALSVVPAAAPCWYPGDPQRILFAGGDGVLYHLAFDGYDPSSTAKGREANRPEALVWNTDRPGLGDVFVSNPCGRRSPSWAAGSSFRFPRSGWRVAARATPRPSSGGSSSMKRAPQSRRPGRSRSPIQAIHKAPPSRNETRACPLPLRERLSWPISRMPRIAAGNYESPRSSSTPSRAPPGFAGLRAGAWPRIARRSPQCFPPTDVGSPAWSTHPPLTRAPGGCRCVRPGPPISCDAELAMSR
jgi:hypothetical protein